MNFVDSEYLALLLITFGVWLALRPRDRAQQIMLLIASFFFYGFHQWQLVFLLGAYCIADWLVGLAISRGKARRAWLTAGVAFNLGMLAFWKYTPLLVNTAAVLLLGSEFSDPPIDEFHWYLPIGISFYAFTGIAYLVDVYRGDTPAERDLFRFSLYISFFPQLVAGPILRAHEFLDDLQPGAMPRRSAHLTEACMLMARGSFKKLVIADGIGRAIDPFFLHVADPSTDGVWSLPFLYLYSLQIFFDFSGYTDLARGAGLMFGFRWPENFNRPYLAASVREFWRRWHMSLSRFLRDYLYIPLGGGRGGSVRVLFALMLTMLLGGLWHGAAWSFMVWGGLHGLFLVVHRLWSRTRLAETLNSLRGPTRVLWQAFSVFLTVHLVTVAWSFFRLSNMQESLTCIRKLVDFDSDKMFVGASGDPYLWSLVAGYLCVTWVVSKYYGRVITTLQATRRIGLLAMARGGAWGTIAALLVGAYFMSDPGRGDPFIYFRF